MQVNIQQVILSGAQRVFFKRMRFIVFCCQPGYVFHRLVYYLGGLGKSSVAGPKGNCIQTCKASNMAVSTNMKVTGCLNLKFRRKVDVKRHVESFPPRVLEVLQHLAQFFCSTHETLTTGRAVPLAPSEHVQKFPCSTWVSVRSDFIDSAVKIFSFAKTCQLYARVFVFVRLFCILFPLFILQSNMKPF